ncbi:transcription factor bHLH106-like [Typha angustifolia]|uniref:transcription factor bHLH106-like n=1 Tax=Typha angustifolia TaxID=59011 RepID=UPI003C2CC6DE
MGSHSDMYPNMSDTGRDGIYVPCLVNPTSTSTSNSTSISMPPGYFTASSSYPKVADPTSAAVAAAVDNRALLASQNHREAEKRRRERIKSHLDRLRSILACEPKIDKASLLAKAVEIMRDLKQRISDITSNPLFLIPTETDEIVVLPSTASPAASAASTSQRLAVFDASICCDDRSDLLPDLIETLRSLRMKILRAEMATMGGRMRNQLLLAREDDEETDDPITGGEFLRDALKSLVDRPSPVERSKRRRVAEMT